MRRGKDVMSDKPGVTTLAQLAEVERAVAETGRVWSVCLGRLTWPAVREALRLTRAGEIGRLVHTTSLAPHRLNRALRPSWFFDRAAYGGILCDIGSHQIDQFLVFTGSRDAQVVTSTVAGFGEPPRPGFEDFAEVILATRAARGYVRLDWFTPDGLPTWGDGRLFVLGTEGTIEVRKNLDPAGRAGTDHLFLATRSETRHIDCSRMEVAYYRDFAADVAERTERAMPQAQVFAVCRLALKAQNQATRFAPASAGG